MSLKSNSPRIPILEGDRLDPDFIGGGTRENHRLDRAARFRQRERPIPRGRPADGTREGIRVPTFFHPSILSPFLQRKMRHVFASRIFIFRSFLCSFLLPFDRPQITTVASKLNYERVSRFFVIRAETRAESSGGKANLNDDQARAFHSVHVPICRETRPSLSLSKQVLRSRRKNRKEEEEKEEERRRIRRESRSDEISNPSVELINPRAVRRK